MAGPLVLAPYAPAAAKAAAAGWKVLQPVLRYGPTTLRAIDTFRTPPQLGPATQDVGRQQRLRELVDDAVAGARIGVASLPGPLFPGGPLFPLNPGGFLGGLLGAELLKLLQTSAQTWGDVNARAVEVANSPAGQTFETGSPSTLTFRYRRVQVSGPTLSCGSGSVQNAPNISEFIANPQTDINVSSVTFRATSLDNSTTCGTVSVAGTPIPTGFSVFNTSGTLVGGSSGFVTVGQVSTSFERKRQWDLIFDQFDLNGEPWTPWGTSREAIGSTQATIEPSLSPSSPSLLQEPAPLVAPIATSPASNPDPVVGATLPVPGAAGVPSNPTGTWSETVTGPSSSTAAGGSVGTLSSPAVAFVPQPATVPRPTPGPTLPEFEPEPERRRTVPPAPVPVTPAPAPAPAPGTPQVVPGSVPGTTPTVFPAGDPPAAPGTSPGETPTTTPTITPSPGPQPVPAPAPGTFPAGDPAPTPGTPPGTAPGTVPGPTTTPGTQPAPAPAVFPVGDPVTSPAQPGVVPVRGPQAEPTTLPGELVAPAPLPVPVTSPESDFVTPGAEPVTGVTVRPDLVSIAREVGRIEQKTQRILNGEVDLSGDGGGGGVGECRFETDPIWQQILSTLLESDGPGAYELQGPCDRDEEGNLLEPVQAQWGLSIGIKGTIIKRLDALAELLQAHKNQRQPICTPGRAVGQPVTVTFEEVQEGPDA